MENASKALLMAGGMLFAILIISLLIYAWSLFSKYQASKDELDDIEDTAKFNEQFMNYDREKVQGYELLSLVNKVNDYNYRMSSEAEAKNDQKYSPITLTISLNGKKTLFAKNGSVNQLFMNDNYTNNKFKSDIIDKMQDIEKAYGGIDCATKIAKGIDGIILTPEQIQQNITKGISEQDSKTAAVKKFNSCSNNIQTKYTDYQRMENEQKANIYKYYEYMQFKKALFDSQSSAITYDTQTGTGRITAMKFVFTGDLH